MRQIKLLLVEDSLFMQKILRDILDSDPQISVVGTARDGEDTIAKNSALHPDVVTLDMEFRVWIG